MEQLRFAEKFPLFPPQPKLWVEKTVGSLIFLWPPCFFQKWAGAVAGGEVLMLHEEPGDKVAGPFCTAAPLPSLTPLLTWKKAPSITSSWSIHLDSYHHPRQR